MDELLKLPAGWLIAGAGAFFTAICALAAAVLFAAWQLKKNGPIIKDFNETGNVTKFFALADVMQRITSKIGMTEIALQRASDEIAVLVAAQKARSAAESEAETKAVEQASHEATAPSSSGTVGFAEVKKEWDAFVALFKKLGRTNNLEVDGRSLGQAAFMMVDGRKSRPLTNDNAENVAALHSDFRSLAHRYEEPAARDFLARLRQTTAWLKAFQE